MPDPFSPKFVDLVRNNSTTQGTGNFVLGSAPSGYASFASAVAAGESFYYSALGVDKPAEREVGRGTMQSNGTISRTPISGAKTSFTSGTKTISLIAAAEWFAKLEALGAGGGGGSAGVEPVATRAALAAASTAKPCFLTEARRDGLFLFDSTVSAALIAADSAQGIYVAPASGSGAWVRQFDGPLVFDWFGAVAGDYATGVSADCLAAWNALNAYLQAVRRNVAISAYGGATEILFPGAQYYFSDTLQIKLTMRLRGMGVGQPSGLPTILRFAADKAGIVVNRHNTLGDVEQTPATTGGDGSLIEGFFIFGAGGTTTGVALTDLLKSGIRLRARATVRDCYISSFAGAGICISCDTSVAASNAYHGNANNWRVDNVRVERNKAGGMWVSGGDANSGTAINVDASANGRYGICDAAFLGNSYIGCHTDGNGIYANIAGFSEIGVVSFGGNRYYGAPGVSTATLQATTPGTDASKWVAMGAGGVVSQVPLWDGTGNYVPSGAYFQSGSANNCVFSGCYYEGGQAPPQITGAGIVLGGFMGSGLAAGAPHLVGNAGIGLKSQKPFTQSITYADASSAVHAIGGDMSGTALELLTWNSSVATPSDPSRKSSLTQDKATGDVYWNSVQIDFPLRLTGYSTARTYGGRSQAESRYVVEIKYLALGNGNAARLMAGGSAAPATGFHAAGELIFNNSTVAGAAVGWKCVASGTPGTWEPFGEKVTLTGDVTGSGTGSFAATIAANAVSFAKLQDVSAAGRLIGRGSAGGSGDPEEITLGSGLSMTGTALSASPTIGAQGTAASVTGTTAETVLYSLLIPANAFKVGDQLRVEPLFTYTNNANAKTWKVALGPTLATAASLATRSPTTTASSAPIVAAAVRALTGAANTIRVYEASLVYVASSASGMSTSTVDWTVANTLYVTGTLANAADTLTLECVRVARV